MLQQLDKLFHRRDLLKHFILSDLKVRYRNKVLGFFWTLLDPLLMMIVYVIFVGVIFKRAEPQFPVLLLTALLAWQWFTTSISQAVNSVYSKGRLLQTVKFPAIILPTSKIAAGLIDFILALIVLMPLLFIFNAAWSWNLLWFPVLVLIQLIATLGLGFFVSVLGIYFQDTLHLVQFGLRILFYLSPVLYSVQTRIPEAYQQVYLLANPFASLIESYKNIFVRGVGPNEYIYVLGILGIVAFVIALRIFNRREPEFTKVI